MSKAAGEKYLTLGGAPRPSKYPEVQPFILAISLDLPYTYNCCPHLPKNRSRLPNIWEVQGVCAMMASTSSEHS